MCLFHEKNPDFVAIVPKFYIMDPGINEYLEQFDRQLGVAQLHKKRCSLSK